MGIDPGFARWVRVCVLGCGSLFMVSPQAAEPLRVAVFDIPPYGATTHDGRIEGLYVSVMQAVARQAGYVPSFRLEPFARVQSSLQTGAADATISFPTIDTTSTLIAVAPIMDSDVIVVPRKGLSLGARADLKRYRIGRLRGGCIDLALGDSAQLIELNTFSEGLRMLNVERLDGVCLTRETYALFLGREKLGPGDFGSPLLLNRRKAWLFLRPEAPPAMQSRLHDAVRVLNKGNILLDIQKAYLPLNP